MLALSFEIRRKKEDDFVIFCYIFFFKENVEFTRKIILFLYISINKSKIQVLEKKKKNPGIIIFLSEGLLLVIFIYCFFNLISHILHFISSKKTNSSILYSFSFKKREIYLCSLSFVIKTKDYLKYPSVFE